MLTSELRHEISAVFKPVLLTDERTRLTPPQDTAKMRQHLQLDTSDRGNNRRYSFMPTPLEMHATYHQDVQQRSIQPSISDINQQQAATEPPAPSIVSEKEQQLQQERVASPYNVHQIPEQHPANFAPFADNVAQAQYQSNVEAPQFSYGPPPASPGPLPAKIDPAVMHQPPLSHAIAVEPDVNPLRSPNTPQFPPPAATATSRAVPLNDILTYHQPGQISHPNQEIKGGTWSHGLCECSDVGTCCLGILCPCLLYGKTQYRLSMRSRKDDPTNLLGYESCNGSCTGMVVLCGCQWLLATIQHTRTRKAYDIRGDITSDCVRATCCTCCTLIQDEKEIKKREEERGKAARAVGAALVTPYLPPSQMAYAPPPT